MATKLSEIVVDAAEPTSLARWWSEVLGWAAAPTEFPDEQVLRVPGADPRVPALLFAAGPDPKRQKNRVHVDLSSRSAEEQVVTVERLVAAGASRVDIGQHGTPWVVLADPEGNELCVLEPRPEYRNAGLLAGITFDVVDPRAVAPFWAAATGFSIAESEERGVLLLAPDEDPADRRVPDLVLLPSTDPKVGKLRWHLDVEPVGGTSIEEEADRLRDLGARDLDIGQHDDPATTWIVLADPEGNELCVVSGS